MTTEATTEDEFGAFFDQLTQLGKNPVPADFGKPAEAVTPPAAEAPVETTETTTTVDPEATATEPAATGDDGQAAATTTVDPVGRVEPVVAQPADNENLISRLVDALDKRAPAPAPAPAPQPVAAPPLYSADELKVLEQAQKDYPDIMSAISLALRGATVTNQQQIFSQLGQVLGPQLQNMQTMQIDYQYDSLRRAIPDYDAVAEPVIQWARTDKSIPPFLRKAYEGVIEQGDVSEIKHLVDTWRTATGTSTAKPAAQTTQPKPAVKANELSEAAKQAAASLAPVVSKRTAVVTSAVPSSFDDAFDHWIKASAKT